MSQTEPSRAIRFVVFTGPSQSGKSTAAALLVSAFRKRGRTAMQASFEFPMKLYLASLLGRKLHGFQSHEQVPELLSKTPIQFINLELAHMRFNYGPGVLGKLLLARSRKWSRPPQYIVVSDGTSVLDCRALGRYFLVQVMRERIERVYPFCDFRSKYACAERRND